MNEVKITVTAENDTASTFKAVTSGLRDVETASDKAGNALKNLGKGGTGGKPIKAADLVDVDPGKLAGTLTKSFGSAGKLMANPVGLAIGTGIALAAAPVMSSLLAGAVVGGVGLGGIAGGIALVADSPAVASASKSLGKKFMTSLEASAKTSFEAPVLRSLDIIDKAAARAAPKIGAIFSNTAPALEGFTASVTRAGDAILDSFVNASAQSGPVIEALGQGIELLADGVASFVDKMAEGGPTAASNILLITGALGDLISGLGTVIGWMNKLTDNPLLTGGIFQKLREHYKGAAEGSDELAGETEKLAGEMNSAASAAAGEQDALAELSAEIKAQSDPVFGLLDAQEKLQKAQDKVSSSTKKNGRDSRETRTALRDLAKAAIEVEGRAGALGKAFDGKLTPQLRATLRAAGLTDRQISDLGKEFERSKNLGNSFAKNYRANIQVTGAAAARNSLYSVKDVINDIPRSVNIAMRITGNTNVSSAAAAVRKNMATGGIAGAANGATSGGLTWTGEQGPELLDLPPGTRVHSAGDSRRIANERSGSGGGDVRLFLDPSGERGLVAALMKALRAEVLNQGGNVQLAIAGRPA